jgi:hypothetical protein
MVKMPRKTAAGFRNDTGQRRAERQGKAQAAAFTAALGTCSSKGMCWRAASERYRKLHAGQGAVYPIARATKCRAAWLRRDMVQLGKRKRCMECYAQHLRQRLGEALQLPGGLPADRAITMMYGSAAWGAQRGSQPAPVKWVRRWFEQRRGFRVCQVDEYRTTMVHSRTMKPLTAVGQQQATGGKTRRAGVGEGRVKRRRGKAKRVHGFLRQPADTTNRLSNPAGTASGIPRYVGRDDDAARLILIAGRSVVRPPELRRGEDKRDAPIDYGVKSCKRKQRVRPQYPLLHTRGRGGAAQQ